MRVTCLDGLSRYCSDIICLFAKPLPVLSLITNQAFYFIYDTHGFCSGFCSGTNYKGSLGNVCRTVTKEAPLDSCFAGSSMIQFAPFPDQKCTKELFTMDTNVCLPWNTSHLSILAALLQTCSCPPWLKCRQKSSLEKWATRESKNHFKTKSIHSGFSINWSIR